MADERWSPSDRRRHDMTSRSVAGRVRQERVATGGALGCACNVVFMRRRMGSPTHSPLSFRCQARDPEATVRIAILGDLAVFDDEDRPIAVQGRNQRTLLASLATRPGTVISADALVEAIWELRPPGNAANAVQTVVSRLRAALGDGVLLTRPPGYVLGVTADDVDAEPVRAAGRRGAQPDGGRRRRGGGRAPALGPGALARAAARGVRRRGPDPVRGGAPRGVPPAGARGPVRGGPGPGPAR